ncbi:MAG: glycosyltransferase family 2 protein [Cytophagaceae bacterium]|jgi:glycosyltransferase involved in cell wall biosynthesis|nr:glycosyltransferase family 2 protein [Cytophagaceae bacterium]
MSYSLTIILLTYNEESNIPDLITNLQSIQAPVFVVDSYSTDATISLIEQQGWKYVQHPFENYSKQRNWAQTNNPYSTEWVLHLDADERLTPELVQWLTTEFNPKDDSVDGYMFGRRAIFMGQWIKSHFNYHLRLYRTAKGKCEDKAYDQHFMVNGLSKVIKGKHMTSKVCDTIDEFILKHNKWALLEAKDIVLQSAVGEVQSSIKGTPIEKTRWLKNNFFHKMPLFLRAFLYFLYRYFLKLGFLDGTRGFIFHVLQAFWFRFLVDAKVYEMKTSSKR